MSSVEEVLAEDIWADVPTDAERDLIRLVLASDWLAAHTAAAEARGAQAVLDAVERTTGTSMEAVLCAAREAARNAGDGR